MIEPMRVHPSCVPPPFPFSLSRCPSVDDGRPAVAMTTARIQAQLQQAVAHHQAGRLAEAEVAYARLCAVAPRHFDAFHLAGSLALQQGRTTDALALLGHALTLAPTSLPCATRHAVALMQVGRLAEAETELRGVVERQADYVDGWDKLGHCLKRQDRLEDACACQRRVVALKPGYALGWHHYGSTLALCGRAGEAVSSHEKALALDPGLARAHFGIAQALLQSGRPVEAIAAFDRFLQREPKHLEARSQRLFALQYVEGRSREEVFAEHQGFGRSLGRAAGPAPEATVDRAGDHRLRVGVLSPDLRQHSCAYFIEPLLQRLDRDHWELFLYHDHFREDAVSERLRALASTWRNLVGRSNADVESILRADRLDVLVDLAGHTAPVCRLPVFARRVAPVQISYLGYPDTSGVPGIDVRFTDEVADPTGDSDAFATEKLVRFAPTAWCYQPPAQAPDPLPPPAATASAPVTFGCFNNPAKITDTTLRLWADVLAAVPDSRLLLKGRGLDEEATVRQLRGRLARLGLPEGRVELIGRTPGTAGHLACYHRIDIALDTYPYQGTTTTCEALWMGRPVVTLRGDRHVSRVGASLLTALGRPDWIAETPADYVRIATELAADRPLLARESASLRDRLTRSTLMDHAAQARRFADAMLACQTGFPGR